MNTHPEPKHDPAMIFIVVFMTMMGAAVRLMMPLSASAPLNDGGLFHTMMLDLQASGFALPTYTTYNQSQIPFAYPPLGIYLAAMVSSIFNLPAFDVIRILPPLVSALSIPAFYLLAYDVLKSKPQTAVAVMVFALLPRVLDWQIMGGGVTRAPGFLFALLAMRELYIMYSERHIKRIHWIILFCALSVYTHPEAATHVALSAMAFYLLVNRSRAGIVHSIIVGIGTIVLTAPWWGLVIARHGAETLLAPVTAAGQDSAGIFSRLFTLVGFQFTDELFLNIVAILGLLGLALTIIRGQYMLAGWLALTFLIEPRGGTLFMMIPHAMLAGVAVEGLILPGLAGSPPRDVRGGNWAEELLGGRVPKIILGYIFMYGVISAFVAGVAISNRFTLKPLDLEAMQWAQTNTAADSRFVLITGETPLRDSSSEWFPTLTGRKSLATVFGYEWVADGNFSARTDAYLKLQQCARRDETCLLKWQKDTAQVFDYIYIRKYMENTSASHALVFHLSASESYEQVFDSDGVVIFKQK